MLWHHMRSEIMLTVTMLCSSIKAARASATELVVSVRNGVGVVARLPNGEGDGIRKKRKIRELVILA